MTLVHFHSIDDGAEICLPERYVTGGQPFAHEATESLQPIIVDHDLALANASRSLQSHSSDLSIRPQCRDPVFEKVVQFGETGFNQGIKAP